MTRDDILALLSRRTAAFEAHNAAALTALHPPDGVVASPLGGTLEGADEIERVYHLWLSAFSDLAIRDQTAIVDADGARAVQIVHFTGTHTGEFFALPATGRHVDVTVACVLTFANGAIAEERRIYDFTGLLVQVGVLKAKPRT